MPQLMRSIGMRSSFYVRYAKIILIAAFFGLPVIAYGVVGSTKTIDNDVRNWLPSGFQETDQYDSFVEQFERDDVVVVSWPGCKLQDERLATLSRKLVENESHQLFQRVVTGASLVSQLRSDPFNLSQRVTLHRLRGVLLGTDDETTAAVCVLTPAGAADRAAAVQLIVAKARQLGLSPDDLHMGGPTIDQLALEAESRQSLRQYVALSAIIAGLIAWFCLGQLRLTCIVFAVALYGAGASLAIVYFCGTTLNLIMIVLPTLVYVLGLSCAVHLVNYYRDAVQECGDLELAPFHAVKHGWLPCCLASLTTGLGLISLLVSDVRPVEDFGFFAGLGVIASLGIVFLMLPSALQIWPPQPVSPDGSSPSSTRWFAWQPMLVQFGENVVLPRYRFTITACCLLMLWAGWSLQHLETTVSLQARFAKDSRIVTDYRWLEQNVGPLVPMEVVLRFGPDHPTNTMERVRLTGQVAQSLLEMEEVGGAFSAATFAPPVPTGGGISATARRAVVVRRLGESKDEFVQSRLLHIEPDGAENWRVSARVVASNELDYGRFIQSFKDRVEPLLPDPGTAEQRIDVVYTGMIPLIYKAQRVLFSDLFESFFTAFIVIFVVILVIFRSMAAAVISMAPNLFPALVIFGGMSALGMKVDLGCMVTASVALGIAVDDTMHFLTWFRRGGGAGMSRVESIRHAYRRCGLAMVQTTLICGLGLLVFRFSSYNPTKHFAEMMMMLLAGALVGDLIFLPAVLRSQLGKLLETNAASSDEADTTVVAGDNEP